jgi:uncharacterized protein (TIGR02391 family)
VLSYCTAELLQDNYFHAVLEATKGLFERVRKRTGLQADGSTLVDQAFGGEAPRVAFNALRSDSERSEQRGLMNLCKGVYLWHLPEPGCTLASHQLAHDRAGRARPSHPAVHVAPTSGPSR